MGDNPERLNTEASFAALCGVSPIEYSSGRWRTRRLNHGGDRRANAALHRIVFTRLRHDPRTQAYYERRTQEGKTRREIIRCPERYAAREVFNLVRPVARTPALQGRP
ncbi:transposase [Streptomyces sp. NPDC014676]